MFKELCNFFALKKDGRISDYDYIIELAGPGKDPCTGEKIPGYATLGLWYADHEGHRRLLGFSSRKMQDSSNGLTRSK